MSLTTVTVRMLTVTTVTVKIASGGSIIHADLSDSNNADNDASDSRMLTLTWVTVRMMTAYL